MVFLAIGGCFWVGCQSDSSAEPKVAFHYLTPKYDLIGLASSGDTLNYLTDDTIKRDISFYNIFKDNGVEYFSFFNKFSKTIWVYRQATQQLVKKWPFDLFIRGEKVHHSASVYIKSLDSIFVIQNKGVSLFDSLGRMVKSVPLSKDYAKEIPFFDNDNLPVFIGEKMYVPIRPQFRQTDLNTIKGNRVLYEFDFKSTQVKRHYSLPEFYHKQFYGYPFLYTSFCFNRDSEFVFSFGADSSIYSANSENYLTGYTGRSKYQANGIMPCAKQDVIKDEGYKNYALNDAYSSIYYNPYKKRYLRVVRHKISEVEYPVKRKIREQSIIILDENFEIVGESLVDDNVNLQKVFFTENGNIYAELKSIKKHALQFIRLEYDEKKNNLANK